MKKITKGISMANIERITLLLMIFSTTMLFSHPLSSKEKNEPKRHHVNDPKKGHYDLNSCLSFKETSISNTVALPIISVQPSSSSQSVCVNVPFSPLSITATDVTTYEWFQNETASTVGGTPVGDNSDSYLPLSDSDGTYYYYCVVSNGNGSVTSDLSGAFIVTELPYAGELSGINEICFDGGTTFVSDGDSGGVWSSSATSVATVNATTGVITPISEGTAIITYTVIGTGGCENATATRVLMVSAYPSGGNLSSDQNVCPGYLPKEVTISDYTGEILKWQKATDISFTTPIDIVSTETVLTPIEIGTISQTTYIRAVVVNKCFEVYSPVLTLTLGQTTVWDGTSWDNGVPDITKKVIINGVYDMTTLPSFEACACDVLGTGELIIEANKYIVLDKALFNDNVVTIKNSGMLVQIDDEVANEEAITVERYTTPMTHFDYTYWSSPVQGETLIDLTPDTPSDKFYSFNAGANSWENVFGTTIMEAGKGYVARAPDSFSTTVPSIYSDGKFIGVPNNGVIAVEVVKSEANKWNLIGNPYPSALNAEDFLSLNSNLLESTIYLWTHNTPITEYVYNSNDYASFNPSGGVRVCPTCPMPTKNIASGQAFFVSAKYSGNVIFNNSMRHRSYDNTQFFRANTMLEEEKHRFWLNFTNANGAFKQTLIGYIENATDTYDSVYDGENFNANSYVNLYSINDTKKLSIQARALPFVNTDAIPLGYSSTIAGIFSISLESFDGLFESQDIYLKDNDTQTIHNLKTEPYTFVTATGTYNNRFEIVYLPSTSLSTPSFVTSNVILYKNQQTVKINSANEQIDQVKIYDMQGRLVHQKKNINSFETTISVEITNQLLMVQIHLRNGIIVTKKII